MQIVHTMMVRAIPYLPYSLVKRMSRRYIAGSTLQEALDVIKRLNRDGFGATLDVLGETSQTAEEANAMATAYELALQGIAANALDAEISLKPTALDLLNDSVACNVRLERVLEAAAAQQVPACLDMEDTRCTSKEIELFERLQLRYRELGLAIQAYLKRSHQDVQGLLVRGSRLRICKGIYLESEVHLVQDAGRDRSAINPHFLGHVRKCFEAGSFVSIATHDEGLINDVLTLVQRDGIDASAFEFQMLLGVTEPMRDKLRDLGFNVRIYVPYGVDWYGYSTRRLKENPRIAGYVFRAMIGL